MMCLMILISIVTLFSFAEKTAEALPRFEQPILITSAGQSADVQIGGVLAKRAGLIATLSKTPLIKNSGIKKLWFWLSA